MSRIVLNTFGSFGDIHPYLAIAIELKRRGHSAVVATSEVYRPKIEAEGLEFAPVRPDVGELLARPDLVKKIWHPRRGPETLIRGYLMPGVEQSYDDLSAVCADADLLLTHAAAYAGPVVAEKLNMRWLSVVLQPLLFFSAYDEPVLAGVPGIKLLHLFGPSVTRAFLNLARRQTAHWAEPVQRLRKRVGLQPSKANPMFEGQFSPFGTLALFSRHFAAPQPDWPDNTVLTGFPFYDRPGVPLAGIELPKQEVEIVRLARFLAEGPPPVLFTLGSSAVMEPGTFYRESFEAALRLEVRAVLLVGLMAPDALPQPIPASIHIAAYAPYSELMLHCAASVHQGGIGTTAQALRSGRPMVVVPWSHDQPDNAARVERLGVARTIPRTRYKTSRIDREVAQLLGGAGYAKRAREIGELVAREDGVTAACDAIEAVLR
jgi:rhamnosyltransferase subunit B